MLSPVRSALTCACLIALTACSVGNAYHRPPTAVPTQFNEARTVAAAEWPDSGWWRGFGSEELDALIAEAQSHNDDLAAAVARVEQADALARIAGAALLPTVDFSAGAARQRSGVSLARREIDVFNPQFIASYEIDFWGKNRALRRAAVAAATASRFDRQTVALTVVRSVATTFFQALEASDRLRVAHRNLANGERLLRGLRVAQTAGTVTALDVAQQETAVAVLDAGLPPLLQQYRQALYGLAVLVGRSPESFVLKTSTLAALATPAVGAGLPSQLLSRRPDIAAAEQQLVAANADIGAARAALFPSISLTASGGFESTMLSSLIAPGSRIYAIGAGLTQPIFHGRALHGRLAYDEARYAELLSAYHKTVLTAFANVENALAASRQTGDRQRRQRDAVATAQRAYGFASRQLSAGTVNLLAVLNTENALFGAEDVLVQVDYAHAQSLVDLYTALGGGWQATESPS